MKTLVVYNKNTGNVSFTQSISDTEDVEYDFMITDIPDNRVVARVDNGEVILEDTPEVKQAKEKLKILNEYVAHTLKNVSSDSKEAMETINKLTKLTNCYFKVLVAGYGANKGYAKNEELLEQKIRESNFSDRIELIKVIPRDSMCKLYNRADALVITSIQEGQPMVALEAACCGLPIFSTRCGGVEDYVTNDIGRIVDITDSEAMANYLSDFIEGRIIFNKENIRKTVINLFGKEAFMNKIGYEFERLTK